MSYSREKCYFSGDKIVVYTNIIFEDLYVRVIYECDSFEIMQILVLNQRNKLSKLLGIPLMMRLG